MRVAFPLLLKSEGDRWITIHPHGKGAVGKYGDEDGRPVLLDGEGNIVGGSVPKELHGKNIKHAFKKLDEKSKNPAKRRSNPFNVAPQGGWKEADKVPQHPQKTSSAVKQLMQGEEHKKEPKHKVGTQIHYTGDQANVPGTFEVEKIRHIEGNPYYDLREVDGSRRFNRVGEFQIHDEKRAGTRFIPKDILDTPHG